MQVNINYDECRNSEEEISYIREKVKDMTKEQLTEEYIKLAQEKKSQEDFILNISHDLRSPLNIILSIFQCYKMDYGIKNDNKFKGHMDMIKRNCLKMLKLVNNLIDTTKLNRNHYNLQKENIDIINLIESNVSNIDKYAKLKNISLVFDTNVEECIMAVDCEAIDRIITNLVSNAIKFSSEGSSIFINALKHDNTMCISVKDQGIGIPESEQKRIFDRFEQSSLNSKKEYAGSGIGLDLVKRLVDAHGGNISIKSEVNVGSEFIIKMPIEVIKGQPYTKNKKLNSINKVDVLEVEFSDIYL